MALKSSDIRPVLLAQQAFSAGRESWKEVAMSAGIFALLSALITVFTPVASREVALFAEMAGMFTMFLATITASLVTSARVLGVEIPALASAMVNDRQFWRYVWGGVVCTFLAGLVAVVVVLGGLSMVPNIPVPGVKDSGTLDLTPVYCAIPVGAILSVLLAVRLSMVLPAVVVGEKVSVSASWRRTRGITMKIALAALVTLGGFYAVELLVKYVGAYALGPDAAPLIATAKAVLRIARSAVEGALAGIVMSHILDEEAVGQPV